MARESSARGVTIFKFQSTGLDEAILEAADYIRERRAQGLETSEVVYCQTSRGDHEFFFPAEEASDAPG